MTTELWPYPYYSPRWASDPYPWSVHDRTGYLPHYRFKARRLAQFYVGDAKAADDPLKFDEIAAKYNGWKVPKS